MIVKVCGVRTPEIAEAAIDAGADWIGIVFEPRSPRYASEAEAHAVREAVADRADVIGVFVEPTAPECDAMARRYRLDAVQVHGDVALDLAVDVSVPVIRGINVEDERAALTLQWWPDCLVLLDAPARELPGGTGRRVPLAWAAEVARHRPIILAGGLGPDDVGVAIEAVRPRGVDASTRLERSPGIKDAELVRAYVQQARAAFDRVREAA